MCSILSQRHILYMTFTVNFQNFSLKKDFYLIIFDSNGLQTSWEGTSVSLIYMYQLCCKTPESRSCVGWWGWQNLSKSSIIASGATHLWWHSCLGSDTGMPAMTSTSAAGLVLTGSSVALWNTTGSAVLSPVDGLRDTKHETRGLEVIFWVEISLRLKCDFIWACCSTYRIWKRREWSAGKHKQVLIELIFLLYVLKKNIQ